MAKKISILFAFAILLVSCNNGSSRGPQNSDPSATYQEKVMSVEEMEDADPAKFLQAGGEYNTNLWLTAFKIHGTVTNNATVATFKDIVIQVIFLTATNTELSRGNYILYEYVPARTTKRFEWKLEKPEDAEKCSWSVVRATPYINHQAG